MTYNYFEAYFDKLAPGFYAVDNRLKTGANNT